MERISHNRKWNIPALKQHHQFPEIRMEDRVAAGNVEIGHSVIDLTKIFTISNHLLHLLPGHALKLLASLSRENIAVLAALVTFICDMPLKSKILAHPILSFFLRLIAFSACTMPYLSDAPQALPHAAGFSSGLSDAPQALPHAAGFSSGLSDAPHAVPHAALAFLFSSSFHPAMFVNAIFVTSCCEKSFGNPPDTPSAFPCYSSIIPKTNSKEKYALFYNLGTKK
jgi:hypothetical protein